MGKFWNAVRAALSAVVMVSKRLARRCAITGALIFETIMSVSAAPMASSTIEHDVEPAPAAPVVDRLAAIRRLAGAFATDTVDAAALEDVPEDAVKWLSVQSRGQLAKIKCASDAALTAHIRGSQAIRGVVAYDRESVITFERAMRQTMVDDGIQQRAVFAPIGVGI